MDNTKKQKLFRNQTKSLRFIVNQHLNHLWDTKYGIAFYVKIDWSRGSNSDILVAYVGLCTFKSEST